MLTINILKKFSKKWEIVWYDFDCLIRDQVVLNKSYKFLNNFCTTNKLEIFLKFILFDLLIWPKNAYQHISPNQHFNNKISTHLIGAFELMQGGLDQTNINTRLQIQVAFAQNGCEQTPKLGLEVSIGTFDYLHHQQNGRVIFDDKIFLQIEFTIHQHVQDIVAHIFVGHLILAYLINQFIEWQLFYVQLVGRVTFAPTLFMFFGRMVLVLINLGLKVFFCFLALFFHACL
ncbi:hypothetical protein BpHYR1_038416 [Brachionus plicatilis]|uniref:Transmembrane protein n=1 Tax=Brachionus plicatilis TaxID=10195 RepID=A0A3M7PNY9_BRAPC|nr:hypothetical protein BpHYR1_038416 [Brachionus plicatilis]